MAMKKYGDSKKAQVFRGREAVVLNEHIQRHGKALSDFTEKQLEAFHADLESIREAEEDAED